MGQTTTDYSTKYHPSMDKDNDIIYKPGVSGEQLNTVLGAVANSFKSAGADSRNEINDLRQDNAQARNRSDRQVFNDGGQNSNFGANSFGGSNSAINAHAGTDAGANGGLNINTGGSAFNSGGFNAGSNPGTPPNVNSNPAAAQNNNDPQQAKEGFSMSMNLNFSEFAQGASTKDTANGAASPVAADSLHSDAKTGAAPGKGLGYALEKMSKNENPDSAMNPVLGSAQGNAGTSAGEKTAADASSTAKPSFEQALNNLYASYGKKRGDETPAQGKAGSTPENLTKTDQKQLAAIKENESKLRKLGIDVPVNEGQDDAAQNARIKNVNAGLSQLLGKRKQDNEQSAQIYGQTGALDWLQSHPNQEVTDLTTRFKKSDAVAKYS